MLEKRSTEIHAEQHNKNAKVDIFELFNAVTQRYNIWSVIRLKVAEICLSYLCHLWTLVHVLHVYTSRLEHVQQAAEEDPVPQGVRQIVSSARGPVRFMIGPQQTAPRQPGRALAPKILTARRHDSHSHARSTAHRQFSYQALLFNNQRAIINKG